MEDINMFTCCGTNACNWNDKFDIRVANSADGITIDVKPKDKSKVKSLQKFAESYKDFCGDDCC
jgi:hypothetical protein